LRRLGWKIRRTSSSSAGTDDVQGTLGRRQRQRPGSDDAADILTQHRGLYAGCLWTGMSSGCQSDEYANDPPARNTWIPESGRRLEYAWQRPRHSLFYRIMPSQELAQLFADVVDAYEINLIPHVLIDQGRGSDQQSFWDYGYNAILAIEDFNDFNPYYHEPGDNLEHVDLAYYTEFIKAAIGTFAHSTGCLIPSGIGSLDGTVTAQNGGAPIAGAQVVAQNGAGSTFKEFTDAAGYYTRTLIADTYTVTASAYGFLPATVTDVVIITDTIITLDFTLEDAPLYTVSGTVTEAGSEMPLLAEVAFENSPVSV
jgi:hypothetical protein